MSAGDRPPPAADTHRRPSVLTATVREVLEDTWEQLRDWTSLSGSGVSSRPGSRPLVWWDRETE